MENSPVPSLPKSARCLGLVADRENETPSPTKCNAFLKTQSMHLTFVPPHYGKQNDMMPVLSMTHKLALERKSASYGLAKRE